MADDGQVVRDEHVGQAEVVLQVVEQVDTCAWIETSSADTGSSSTIRRGSTASARATPIRWRCPPENSCGKRLTCSGFSPTRSSSSRTRGLHLSFGDTVQAHRRTDDLAHPLARVQRGDRILEDELDLAAHRLELLAAEMGDVLSAEAKRAEVGSSSRTMQRASVLLPQPDSPTIPSVSPSCSASETSSTACTWPTVRSIRMPCLIGK